MERRVAPLAALIVLLALAGVALGAAAPVAEPLAAVTWPPSTLLLSEVQTGGASASDEFAEITNAGSGPVDLAGLELVYVTSSGGTVTRKASWSSSVSLEPGRHLLIANGAGIYAGLADATYSGGFAATGGAVVLRPIGGAPIDAVGWGDATNGFVEGAAAQAPAAGASIERLPGGLDGNTIDTNANASDWFAQPTPNPQSLAAPPAPAPDASPTPGPSSDPTPGSSASGQPTPTATPAPTPSSVPSGAPTAEPTIPPSPEPSPPATPAPTAVPTPSLEPTSEPTPEPTPTVAPTSSPFAPPTPVPTTSTPPIVTPSPTATPGPTISIAAARGLAAGTTARVAGVLTTHLGALEAGRKAFIQDDTGGIAVYLDVAVAEIVPADTLVIAEGTVDERFGERTLRVAPANLVVVGEQQRPAPWELTTGEIGEASEGWRAILEGVTVGAPSQLSDGLGLMVDDGSGAVRVIVGPDALGGVAVPSGTHVIAVGPVGQRDSTGTGLSGYRVHVTEPSDFGVLAPPAPSAAPTATPAPTPTSSPSPAPTSTPALPSPTPAPTRTPAPSRTPGPTATATPAPTPSLTLTIVEARGAPVGTVVTVAGVVIAEAGRLGSPPLLAIADGTGGIAVRLPSGVAAPARGTTVVVRGQLADPYGQLELRPAASGWRVTGTGSLPAPATLTASQLGEATEGRLAEIAGTVAASPTKGTSGDLTVTMSDAAGMTFKVVTDGSSGIAAGDVVKGRSYRLTGVVGQRASRKGAPDGYRLYLRDRGDIVAVAAPGPGPAPSGGTASAAPVALALAAPEGTTLTIEAIVTAGTSLLDSSGRRIVVQDASGAIEVLLPADATEPAVGTKLRIGGETAVAWGARRLRATAVAAIGSGSISPLTLDRVPAERDEWLLVRLSGTVAKVERLGDRWRADVTVAGGTAVVQGQPGAGIPSTAILAGRSITVTGIVKRPYPTAGDRRFALLPRGAGDVSIGPGGGRAGGGNASNAGPAIAGGSPAGASGGSDGGVDVTPDTDLAALAEHVGQQVRVGGLIAAVGTDGFDLDDGTALAHVVLRGGMIELLPLLVVGDAVAATGVVELTSGAPSVAVDDAGRLLRVGSLGQALPIGDTPAGSGPSPRPSGGASTLAADSTLLGPALAPTSIAALALISLLSVLVTILRRRLAQHRLRAAVVARLATLRPGPAAESGRPAPPAAPAPPSPEPDRSRA